MAASTLTKFAFSSWPWPPRQEPLSRERSRSERSNSSAHEHCSVELSPHCRIGRWGRIGPIGFLMRKLCGCGFGLLGILLLGQVALAESQGAIKGPLAAEKMAQNSTEQTTVPGRDVLVAGAG